MNTRYGISIGGEGFSSSENSDVRYITTSEGYLVFTAIRISKFDSDVILHVYGSLNGTSSNQTEYYYAITYVRIPLI